MTNSLPLELTSFIGRERAIASVRELLDAARLVTLAGAGGSGKTRLALRVARDLVSAYPHGVWLVELASLAEAARVPQAVASVLGARAEAGRSAPAIADFLGASCLLLVLDNCEHLVDACAELAQTILRSCPTVRILATSREPLGIMGETIWRVPTLSVPESAGPPMFGSESVRLFLDRANAVVPGFRLTDGSSGALVELCQRLDGIPLALELAAARVDTLSVQQIAARLDDRFRLLTRGGPRGLPRHQTLQSAVDWSYQLLSPAEARLWRRLSVFSGGWGLEAAESVCAGDPLAPAQILDLLSQLVRKSLVVAEPHGTTVRYRMLETMRQYSTGKFLESVETSAVRQRHLEWCLDLAREAEQQLTGIGQAAWLDRLEIEHDNLRAALESSLTSSPDCGLALAAALWRFWWMHGYLTEARERLGTLLRHATQSAPMRAKALYATGLLATWQADYNSARSRLDEAVTIAEHSGDRASLAFALTFLGRVCRDESDVETSCAYGRRAVALFREIADPWGLAFALDFLGLSLAWSDDEAARAAFAESAACFRAAGDRWSVAMPLRGLGLVAYSRGDDLAARHFFDQSLALFRERGDAWAIAMLMHDLGCVARRSGDLEAARVRFQEALRLWRRLGNKRGCALGLIGLAGVAAAAGRARSAARLFGAAQTVYPTIADVLEPTARSLYSGSLAAARHSAGGARFATWIAAAQAAPADEAIADALTAESWSTIGSTNEAAGAPRASEALSPREREIAGLVARGRTNRQMRRTWRSPNARPRHTSSTSATSWASTRVPRWQPGLPNTRFATDSQSPVGSSHDAMAAKQAVRYRRVGGVNDECGSHCQAACGE